MKKAVPSLGRLALLGLACGLLALLASGPARHRAVANEPVIPVVPVEPPCLPKDPQPPVVKVKVRVPACSAPGEAITYVLCIENCSPSEAHHVLVKNPLPANAKFVRADPEPTKLDPELQWQLGTVGGGACREIVLVLQPTNKEDVKNCTRVQFEHGVCLTTRQAACAPVGPIPPGTFPPGTFPPGTFPPGTFPPGVIPPGTPMPPVIDEVPEKKGDKVPKVSTEERAKLILEIQGHKRQYENLPSHYFITVTNTGKVPATNLLVTSSLPPQMQFVRAGQKGAFGEGKVNWLLGDLQPGEKRTVDLVVKASAPGEYCVKAVVRADRDVTAQGESCTDFIGTSALQVTLTEDTDPVAVGNKVSYTIKLIRRGSADLANVHVKLVLPPELKFDTAFGPSDRLGPLGQTVEFAPIAKLEAKAAEAPTYVITAQALKAGEVRVRAEVSADQLERGAVVEEEHTTIITDEPTPKGKKLSRLRNTP